MTEDGFKETEIGPIPEDWEITRLGDLFEIQQGITLCREPGPGKYLKPFLRTSNVFWSRIDLTNLDSMYFSEKQLQSLTLKSKDLLICEGGDIGRTAIWEDQIAECCHQNHLHRLRAKNGLGITPEFYMYWMQFGMLIRGLYSEEGNKTTIPNLSRSRLSNFIIPLPTLPEQKQITHILSTIQEAKERTEDMISTTKELKKSLMSHLFTYGPVPVSEAEHVKLKETEIGPIPEDWEITRLGDLFEIQQGITLCREPGPGKYLKPFLRTSNVFWSRIDLTNLDSMYFSEKQLQSLTLKSKDLLICEGGDIGRTAIWEDQIAECCHQNHLHRLRAKNGLGITPEFYMYWMQFGMLIRGLYSEEGNKTTIPNLSRSRLSNFIIPLPTLPEQKQIANILSAVDSKIEGEENKAKALDAVFKTLLENLMTGKIRVNALEVSS